jgi:HK97 family phage major capsid protein
MPPKDITVDILENAVRATEQAAAIYLAAGSRALTNAQASDLDAAKRSMIAGLEHIGRPEFARRLAEVDRDAGKGAVIEERLLLRVADELSTEYRARRADSTRDRIGDMISTSPERQRSSALAGLWSEFRTQGFSAMDADLSPTFYESRALGSAGGSAIATTFADSVVVYQRTLNPMLDPNVVTISNTRSGAPFTIPRLTADVSYGGSVTAEAGTIAELDPTISGVTLTPYKYPVITLWSAELDQDQINEIEPLIAKSNARELALDAGVHLTTGDGSGKPTGFITSETNGGTAQGTAVTGGANFFGWPDLVTLYGAVASPYRMQGSWMVSTDAFTKILGFRDSTGNPILVPGLGGAPATLLGRPIYENPAMASVGSASKSVAFGDFSAYWVRRVAPLRIELSRDYKYNTDQVALKVVDRLDGELVDAAAVAYLVSSAT